LRDLGKTASQAVHRCAGPMIDLVNRGSPFWRSDHRAAPCAAACAHL